MSESEVARIRRQIELELEAMQRGMHGFAMGVARHTFIRKRMDQIGIYQEKLAKAVGEDVATEIVHTVYGETIK